MIGIEVTEVKKENRYHYIVYYGIGNTSFPVDKRGAWIVGRENNSCDSLIKQIAEDIKSQRYNLTLGKSMKKHEKRVEEYLIRELKR